MQTQLTANEKEQLLIIAREAIRAAVSETKQPDVNLGACSPMLKADGACFVTLTKKANGQLRGCIGTLEAYQPLAFDVRDHAVAAALEDFRFNPVTVNELDTIAIEISRLTAPQKVDYVDPTELKSKIRPGIDGVVIKDGRLRATFLPQVWEKIPDFESFMSQLCYKMGVDGGYWRKKVMDVFVYQVEEFHE